MRRIPLWLSTLLICACGNAPQSTSNEVPGTENQQTCTSGVPFALALEGTSGVPLTTLTTPLDCVTVVAETKDDCGQSLGAANVAQWVLDSRVGYVASSASDQAQLCFNLGATGTTPAHIAAYETTLSGSAAFAVEWPVTQFSGLHRWYRADSYLPSAIDGDVVAVNGTSPWLDLSGGTSTFSAFAQAGREPRMNVTGFARPAIRICGNGTTTGCSGVTSNQHLRVGWSFAELAATDLTLIYVVARANANANYLLVNQSNGNNTGTFLGWTNNTSFRFSLAGPGGSPQITATVAGYSGTPTVEVWTVRLNTGSSTEASGMRLYRNGIEVAAQGTISSQQVTATTIPYIGSQRSDQAGSQMNIFEVIMYKRALAAAELATIYSYLGGKYGLSL